MDGAEIWVHGDAQDQVGQILDAGRIVVFGSVGQTFLYGAKGGEAFILGWSSDLGVDSRGGLHVMRGFGRFHVVP